MSLTALVEQTACWNCKAEDTLKVAFYYQHSTRFDDSEVMHFCPACLGQFIAISDDHSAIQYLEQHGKFPSNDQLDTVLNHMMQKENQA